MDVIGAEYAASADQDRTSGRADNAWDGLSQPLPAIRPNPLKSRPDIRFPTLPGRGNTDQAPVWKRAMSTFGVVAV